MNSGTDWIYTIKTKIEDSNFSEDKKVANQEGKEGSTAAKSAPLSLRRNGRRSPRCTKKIRRSRKNDKEEGLHQRP